MPNAHDPTLTPAMRRAIAIGLAHPRRIVLAGRNPAGVVTRPTLEALADRGMARRSLNGIAAYVIAEHVTDEDAGE